MPNCAFKGHTYRAAICEHEATSFFRTAKGTLWPLCTPCAERHKRLCLDLAKRGRVPVDSLAGATFDLPLDDPDTMAAWRVQDPDRVASVIGYVDAQYEDLVEDLVAARRDAS